MFEGFHWTLLGFLGLWAGTLHLIAAVGGWRGLSQRYPDTALVGTPYRFQSGSMRLANYSFVWTLRVSEQGLGISVFFPFRPGHPPILIPWPALTIDSEIKTVLGSYLKLRVEETGGIWFCASRKIVEKGAPFMRDSERARLNQV